MMGSLPSGLYAVPLAFVVFAYTRTLIPLYGAAATTYLLRKILVASFTLAALNPVRISRSRLLLALGVLLLAAPNTTHWAAVLTSRKHNPVYGPALVHVASLAPLSFLFAAIASQEDTPDNGGFGRPLAAILCYITSTDFVQAKFSKLPKIDHVSNSSIFLAVAGLVLTASIQTTSLFSSVKIKSAKNSRNSKSKSKKSSSAPATRVPKSSALYRWIASACLAASLIMLRPLLSSPVLPHPLPEPYSHPSYPLRILSSVQSVTGLIVVGEALPPSDDSSHLREEHDMHSMRYLRAEHSILGGVWLGEKIGYLETGGPDPWQDSFGTSLGDSVYSTFVLQEAVRMVNSTAKGKLENGLIIGLGTGISATAFSRHDISTTVVEIDPAVYDAARTWFGLPDPGEGKIFLQDARSWVTARQLMISNNSTSTDLFDFVVHDCFSGGGVPDHIFTFEFWRDLKAIMSKEGIVVVNFAGQIKSRSSKAIVLTLEAVFGQCRAFHDSFDVMQEVDYEKDFVNIVFFCSSSSTPLSFRDSRLSDYLGSPLRRHVLSSLPTREVNLAVVKGREPTDAKDFILTDNHNPLGKWQDEHALHHWTLMRQVFKDVYWETF